MYRHHALGQREPGAPEIRVGEVVKQPTATTVAIEGRTAQPVGLKQQLDMKSIRIHSASNDNRQFAIRVGLGKMRPGTQVFLGFEGRWWAGGLGTTATDSQAIFEVDRAAATAIAAACSVTAHERLPLDAGLRRTWRFPDQVVSGGPALVTLQIANEGTTALVMDYCPSWLRVEATRDGSPVRVEALIYSGPSAIAHLPPGASVVLSADLRELMSLDQPGRYEITARFDGHLARAEMELMDAVQSGAVWDVAWTERGALLASFQPRQA